jgi:hypothetical protein
MIVCLGRPARSAALSSRQESLGMNIAATWLGLGIHRLPTVVLGGESRCGSSGASPKALCFGRV